MSGFPIIEIEPYGDPLGRWRVTVQFPSQAPLPASAPLWLAESARTRSMGDREAGGLLWVRKVSLTRKGAERWARRWRSRWIRWDLSRYDPRES